MSTVIPVAIYDALHPAPRLTPRNLSRRALAPRPAPDGRALGGRAMPAALIAQRLHARDFEGAKALLNQLPAAEAAQVLSALAEADRAVAFRLLDKDQAIATFEQLNADEQRSLVLA